MKKIAVYGIGQYYKKYGTEIEKKYDVVGYIDKNGGEHNGKKVYQKIEDVDIDYDYVMIMSTKIKYCFEIINALLCANVEYQKILLGLSLYGVYSKFEFGVTSSGSIKIDNGKFAIDIISEDEFANVMDIMLNECYKFYLAGNKKNVIVDIGMNIGDSTLYFLTQKQTEKVYAFEPFAATYKRGLFNLKDYLKDDRLQGFNYGLSDINEKRTIFYNDQMTCGQSTIPFVNDYAISTYEKWGLIDKKQSGENEIEVKKASDVIETIKSNHKKEKLVLKIDCEGEEYAIMLDLSKNGKMNLVDFIILEWHYKSPENIYRCLEKNNFSYYSVISDVERNMGYIYAWKS